MAERHLCVGPTCWICGEPKELEDMRHKMMGAFAEEKVANTPWRLAQIAMRGIRELVLDMMTVNNELRDQLWAANQVINGLKGELAELKELHRTADVEE